MKYIFILLSYTDDNLNVYENLAKNYEHSLRKGTCNFLNNDIKEVQNYIKNEYNIPVVSNIYLLIYKIIFYFY